ncbi:MAG: NADH-quinone oxidoreductase subunit M [Planctomycetes bacterium]|nr:NADH-quinone oxidoreductase subunit M [Planctomycetota bacterium]
MATLLDNHLLSCMIAVPFIGILAMVVIRNEQVSRIIALLCAVLDLGLGLYLWSRFKPADEGMQLVERIPWMPTFNIEYAVGVDGISILLVLLTTLLTPLCVLCSWSSIKIHVKAFMILILLVEGAMIVVFTALDLFLFFMMWEVTMIPMYFMIILWGGPGRIAAGLKFVLYSLTGSLLLLVGILALHVESGLGTFDIQTLSEQTYSSDAQFWMFLAFLLAFGIKLPMFPFHTWLPDAHAEAPTAGSVILAGVLLKMGGYGFLRICLPIFPDAAVTFAPLMLSLSVVAILYGGFMALAQDDLKKLVAYSSISHMGFVTLGIFVFNRQGIQGAILQMFNHGIVTGAMFLAVGQLYERTHSRLISDYGGLHKTMPRFAGLFCIFAVASFGLPGTCSFIGEVLVLLGASETSYVMVLLAMGGIVLAASYMLWMLQRVVLGQPSTSTAEQIPDLTPRETLNLVPLAIVVFMIGVYPGPLMEMMDACVANLVELTNKALPIK